MNKNKKRLIIAFSIALALIVLVVIPVIAAYSATISVTSNATYTRLPIIVSMNNSLLATNGSISSTGLNTRITSGNSTLKHMLTNNKTLFVGNLTASTTSLFGYSTNATALTAFPIIVGQGGYVTTSDNATLELSDFFILYVDAYVNTASGSGKNIAIKPDGAGYAFKLYVSNTSEITASLDDGACDAVATGITSGEHRILVLVNSSYLYIYVDSTLKDSTALGGASVPDDAEDLVFNQNNVCPYITNLEVYK